MDKNSVYVGDGLYASHDGYMFWLKTPQGNEVALEPDVLRSFLDFVGKTCKCTVTIEPKKAEEQE